MPLLSECLMSQSHALIVTNDAQHDFHKASRFQEGSAVKLLFSLAVALQLLNFATPFIISRTRSVPHNTVKLNDSLDSSNPTNRLIDWLIAPSCLCVSTDKESPPTHTRALNLKRHRNDKQALMSQTDEKGKRKEPKLFFDQVRNRESSAASCQHVDCFMCMSLHSVAPYHQNHCVFYMKIRWPI